MVIIYLIRFGGQPHALPHSLIYSYPLFAFPSEGDLTQWNLPVGMQDLNLVGTKVAGKAASE
jgi:hypothetical protein